MAAMMAYLQLRFGPGPLFRWAHPKMTDASSRDAFLNQNFCVIAFWIRERNRISSGRAVAARITRNRVARNAADNRGGMWNGWMKDNFKPATIRMGATIA